jgi:hypothetical protein
MYSVALGIISKSSIFNHLKKSLKFCSYFLAISRAEIHSFFAAFSIFSSPSSLSPDKCQTSVKLLIEITLYQTICFNTFLMRSAVKAALTLPK